MSWNAYPSVSSAHRSTVPPTMLPSSPSPFRSRCSICGACARVLDVTSPFSFAPVKTPPWASHLRTTAARPLSCPSRCVSPLNPLSRCPSRRGSIPAFSKKAPAAEYPPCK